MSRFGVPVADGVTVMRLVDALSGSAMEVAVIVAEPAVMARTCPFTFTLAIPGADDCHDTPRLAVFASVAVSCCVWPGCRVAVGGLTTIVIAVATACPSEIW